MKKKRRYSRPRSRASWLPGICLAMFLHAGAQDRFSYAAVLDTVKQNAFYRIVLEPALVAKCRTDLADLRILGSNGRFIPYVSEEQLRDYTPIVPDAGLIQKDSSNKHSYLTLQFGDNYQIDRLTLVVRNPPFYKRAVRILAEDPVTGEWDLVTDVPIDPQHLVVRIPSIRTRRLRLDVTNADNTPLIITRVACDQTFRYLLTYLQTDATYRLLAGNAGARMPEYDLRYYTDSMRTIPPDLRMGPVQPVTDKDTASRVRGTEAVPAKGPVKDRSGVLLWTAIVLALLLLLYLSLRMAKAIRQNDADDRL